MIDLILFHRFYSKQRHSLLSLIHQQIIMMPQQCDLPKVRLKFKTDISDLQSSSIEIPRFSKYDAAPSIFLERMKMSKEVHEAFMRYRRLKNSNYTRKTVHHKKSPPFGEYKRMNTFGLRKGNATFNSKIEMVLERQPEKSNENDGQLNRRSKVYSLKAYKQSKEDFSKHDGRLNLNPQTVALKPRKSNGHSMSLHDSTVGSQTRPLEMQGLKCQYETEMQRKQRMAQLFKKSSNKLRGTRGSTSFLIEAWKVERMGNGGSFYLKNQFDHIQL